MALSENYYSSMDKSYYKFADIEPERGDIIPAFGESIKNIGISANPMKDALSGLKAKIFQGASRVELGFMGRGAGSASQGQTTPEQMGADERQDIRELSQFNNVTVSVHATPMHGALSGLGEHGFTEAARELAIHEIEKAIDFAADTTRGGAVVIHTGEFPRPIVDTYGPDFSAYPKEKEDATLHVVDSRTGEIQPVKRDRTVFLPDYETDEKGDYIYIDKERGIRKPRFDEGQQKFVVKERNWDYFINETEKWNQQHPEQQLTVAQKYIREFMEADEARARGWALYHMQNYDEYKRYLEKLEKALPIYQDLEKNMTEDEKLRVARSIPERLGFAGQLDLIPHDVKTPTELIQKDIEHIGRQLTQIEQGTVAYEQEAERIKATRERMVPIKDYALKQSADSIARVALLAMKKTQLMQARDPKAEPLFVAPENIYPEQFGGHPEELKEIIQKSRERMTEELKTLYPDIDQQEARRIASTHIKATFDMGHANLWRKYFNDDPRKSIEDNDKAFKRWLVDQVAGLAKEGMIAHVHVSDNFGFDDAHQVPGQGTVPVKEILEEIKKRGIKDIIVEPGESDVRGMLGGWKEFGSSIYGLSSSRRNSWTEIEHSYFGRSAAPYFLYGESAPDPEQWSLWSGVRLE